MIPPSLQEKATAVQRVVYLRVLERTLEIFGDAQALGAYLKVPAAQVERWLQGDEQPSDRVFLQLVDILTDRQINTLSARSEARDA